MSEQEQREELARLWAIVYGTWEWDEILNPLGHPDREQWVKNSAEYIEWREAVERFGLQETTEFYYPEGTEVR